MKKKIDQYLAYDYPVRIFRYPDGMYCAEIQEIDGLCVYGTTPQEALKQLEGVKEAAFELMLAQGKKPPVPTVRFDIPIDEVKRNPSLRRLKNYMKV